MTAPAERFRSYLYLLAQNGLENKLRSKVDLSGVVQQTLLEAHQAWNDIADQSTERQAVWIRRILQNNLADEARKWFTAARNIDLERSIERSSLGLAGLITCSRSSPSHQIERQEEFLLVADALLSLPEDQRQAIELYHLQGKPLEEVSQLLNRSKSAVAAILYRALQKLRKQLDRDESI